MPACLTSPAVPDRNGAVSGRYAIAVRPVAMIAGGSSRRRSGESPKTSAAETAIARTPPLLCAVSQPAAIAVAPAAASMRATTGDRRSDASTTAGQKPIRKTADCAFGYEIGNDSRPE